MCPSTPHRLPPIGSSPPARATALVKLLIENEGFAPERLSAAGYGEFHPVADNSSAAGQQMNRRVDIVVVPQAIPAQPACIGSSGGALCSRSFEAVSGGSFRRQIGSCAPTDASRGLGQEGSALLPRARAARLMLKGFCM